jgi:predicted  nucleic acid-binding Zn-ribbon protein
MSRRRFDVMLKRATDSYGKFKTFMSEEYTTAENAESVAPKVENLQRSLIDLEEIKKSKETRKLRIEKLAKKIAENQQKVQAIQGKDEVVELSQLNARINELDETVKRELRHLQKPFLKFQTLANNPGYNLSPESTMKLNEYLTDPFNALATEEEGYPLLRNILQKIKDTMDKGKLKLKKSRLRKAEDQINNIINKTALLPLHQNCREVYNRKHQLSSSGIINESRSKRSNLQNNLKDLQRQKRLLETRGARVEKKILETRKRVEKQKEDLEEIVSEISNKDVQILLD